MTQNIGTVLGQLVGENIKKACNTGKSKPAQKRVTMYAKAGKKPMPQPAFHKHANPFAALMATGGLSTHVDDDEQRQSPPRTRASMAKKMTANGPIRGTRLLRPKKPLRTRPRPMDNE